MPTTLDNWGVNHDSGTGALSGYAWSENAGWINFNVTTHNPNGVSIDTGTLKFSGYAWAESVGYVHFQNASPEYYVKQDAGAPTVTTQAVSNIAVATATGNGNITDLGDPNPTQHGVCWSTSANPTIALPTKTQQGAKDTTGAFTSNMTGLSPNTLYYVRAYATNTAGTSYGNQISFNSLGTLATGTPSSHKATVTDVEMWNGSSWVTIFSGTAQLDLVNGGTFPGISDLSLPSGTYDRIRVTFNNAFPVAGTLSYGGISYYTTGAALFGLTNLACAPTTVAGDIAEFTFRNPAWGVLNADVTQTFAIAPITVGPATDYQPTLRFTINDTLLLKGSAGDPSSYYFSLDAPTVSIVEP